MRYLHHRPSRPIQTHNIPFPSDIQTQTKQHTNTNNKLQQASAVTFTFRWDGSLAADNRMSWTEHKICSESLMIHGVKGQVAVQQSFAQHAVRPRQEFNVFIVVLDGCTQRHKGKLFHFWGILVRMIGGPRSCRRRERWRVTQMEDLKASVASFIHHFYDGETSCRVVWCERH